MVALRLRFSEWSRRALDGRTKVRIMKWTTERPTAPGLYWIACARQSEPEIVWVSDAFGADLVVEEHGRDWEHMLELAGYAPGARWYEPITPPSLANNDDSGIDHAT